MYDEIIDDEKYYVLNKDTAAFKAGAIFRRSCGKYAPISDIWDILHVEGGQFSAPEVVENSEDWYRRVYLVGGKFVNQDQAIAAIADLVEDGPAK